MRRLLILPICLLIADPASAQRFAPAQSRAAEPPPRSARISDAATRIVTPLGAGGPLLNTGMPVPVPLGAMSEAGAGPGVLSARVPTSGAPVTIPPEAVAAGVRLYTYTNPQGGLESVAYDPSTGATVVYDQTITYSLQGRLGRFGPGEIPRVGSSSASGIINNPSFSLQPGRAIPDSGIPLLNQASPSYDFRANLGSGPSIPAFTPSPFAGTPMGTLGGGIGPAPSPLSGTPLGTLGGGPPGGAGLGVGSPSFNLGAPSLGGSP